jgi:hypothetical protein
MNKRIYELAEQAEETYTYKDFSPNGGEETKQSKTVNLEKFAELIVDPCRCGCRCKQEVAITDSIIADIKEHFGVEE